jgi:hypothetical protein
MERGWLTDLTRESATAATADDAAFFLQPCQSTPHRCARQFIAADELGLTGQGGPSGNGSIVQCAGQVLI